MPDHPHILVATLGGQPQVVTFTLDLLLQQGFPITKVIVLHPKASAPSKLYQALLRLNVEFSGAVYPHPLTRQKIHFRSQVLELDGQPIDDIVDNPHADGTLDSIHRLLGDLKQQGYRVHLSVSGGRRLMALLAISVAALNFDHHDHIWHLYTPDAVREKADQGKMMHVPADAGVKLIQGRFLSLGAYFYSPALSFQRAQEDQQAQMDAQDRARCTEVANNATAAQLKVLRAFARGLRPQQVAQELGLAPVTINTHKTVLLSLCHAAWNIPEDERLDYHFLAAKFGKYFGDEE
ncbi:MAG TPA: CRISPR-associated ring nuclease [Ktedonosporobacter sp.]|jgi:CRISPR-associated protein Csx14|nr:CRISPR-associated ring nuclease [Ktedonosporobacter sp.]